MAVTPEQVRDILGIWMAHEDVPYYRFRWKGGVALYERDAERGWYEAMSAGTRADLTTIRQGFGPWADVLTALYEAVDSEAAA